MSERTFAVPGRAHVEPLPLLGGAEQGSVALFQVVKLV